MNKVGFLDYRIMKSHIITVNNEKIQKELGDIKFYSLTVRAFKLKDLEDKCEDYQQKAKYLGNLKYEEDEFELDQNHIFKKN